MKTSFFLFACTAASIAAWHPAIAQESLSCNLIWQSLRVSRDVCAPSPTACQSCLTANGVLCFKHYTDQVPGSVRSTTCVDPAQQLKNDPVTFCTAENDLRQPSLPSNTYDSYANSLSDCKVGGGWSMLSGGSAAAVVVAIVVPIVIIVQALALVWFAKFHRGYQGIALFMWFVFGLSVCFCAWFCICIQHKKSSGAASGVVTHQAAAAHHPYGAQPHGSSYGQSGFAPYGMQPAFYAPQNGYVGPPQPMQLQGYPPPMQSQGYPPPMQSQGYPPPMQSLGYNQGQQVYGSGIPMQPTHSAEGNFHMQQSQGHPPPSQQQADLSKPLPYNPYVSP